MSKRNFVKGPALAYVQNDYRFTSVQKMVKNASEQELREVYTSLRDIGQKRLKRLETQTKVEAGSAIKSLRAALPTIKAIQQEPGSEKYKLAKAISALKGKLEGKRTKASDILKSQKQTIKSLQAMGMTGVNEGNVEEFGIFMQYATSIYDLATLDSDLMARAYQDYLSIKEEEEISIVEYFDSHFLDFASANLVDSDQKKEILADIERGNTNARKRRGTGRLSRDRIVNGGSPSKDK